MSDEIIEIAQVGIDIYQSEEKAAIDTQIATAKRFPRDIVKCVEEALFMVTMDKDVAESCSYSLPRGDKKITGPSVHLARIITQTWGNMRAETKVVDITDTAIVSQAICYDLEKNYAFKVTVRKNILQSEYIKGKPTGRMVSLSSYRRWRYPWFFAIDILHLEALFISCER